MSKSSMAGEMAGPNSPAARVARHETRLRSWTLCGKATVRVGPMLAPAHSSVTARGARLELEGLAACGHWQTRRPSVANLPLAPAVALRLIDHSP